MLSRRITKGINNDPQDQMEGWGPVVTRHSGWMSTRIVRRGDSKPRAGPRVPRRRAAGSTERGPLLLPAPGDGYPAGRHKREPLVPGLGEIDGSSWLSADC